MTYLLAWSSVEYKEEAVITISSGPTRPRFPAIEFTMNARVQAKEATDERSRFMADLKKASERLHLNPADPQTGKPVKMSVSDKGMAKFLAELEEE